MFHWLSISILFNKITLYAHYAHTTKIDSHTIAQLVRFSLSPYRPRFNPRQAHVEFVVGKLALGHIILQIFQVFSPLSLFGSTS